jgi:hypothetical protein
VDSEDAPALVEEKDIGFQEGEEGVYGPATGEQDAVTAPGPAEAELEAHKTMPESRGVLRPVAYCFI